MRDEEHSRQALSGPLIPFVPPSSPSSAPSSLKSFLFPLPPPSVAAPFSPKGARGRGGGVGTSSPRKRAARSGRRERSLGRGHGGVDWMCRRERAW
eukprot:CAMPEP_0184715266 /NCGR_PEP_ID=MMETSP0314-20130426/5232_1 /TAXON_ID=38298 /ORGANISM="Rhodella maculata, Strain CCMP 736" /LENGTH=95 /DNA_ID=CAMNT_0027178359 /DNA_START=38 /DNA_END=325 /DNA_ORIENTATION=+